MRTILQVWQTGKQVKKGVSKIGKGVKEDIAYGASDHPHTISELAYLLRDFIGPLPTEDDLLLAEEDDRVRVAVRSPPSADLLRRL